MGLRRAMPYRAQEHRYFKTTAESVAAVGKKKQIPTLLHVTFRCEYGSYTGKRAAEIGQRSATEIRKVQRQKQQQKAQKGGDVGPVPRIGNTTYGGSMKVGCDMHFTVMVSVTEPDIAEIHRLHGVHSSCKGDGTILHGPDTMTDPEATAEAQQELERLGSDGGALANHLRLVSPDIRARLSQPKHLSSYTINFAKSLLHLGVPHNKILQQIRSDLEADYEQRGESRDETLARIAAAGRLRDYFISKQDLENIKAKMDVH